MTNTKYTSQLINAIAHGQFVKDKLTNHGITRQLFANTSITFFPSLCVSSNKFTLGLHPTMGQNAQQIWTDTKMNRVLLTAEIVSEIGDYVILEDHSRYMTLTGNLDNDLTTYCQRVVRAMIDVSGGAQSLGLSVTKFISTHLAFTGK